MKPARPSPSQGDRSCSIEPSGTKRGIRHTKGHVAHRVLHSDLNVDLDVVLDVVWNASRRRGFCQISGSRVIGSDRIVQVYVQGQVDVHDCPGMLC
jgi:hypothetical protein